MKQKDLFLMAILVIAVIVGIGLGAAKTAQKADIIERRDEAQAAALEIAKSLEAAESKVKDLTASDSPGQAYNEKTKELDDITAQSKYRESEVTLLQEVLDRSTNEIEKRDNAIEARAETLNERDQMILKLTGERDQWLTELEALAAESGTPIVTPEIEAPVQTGAPELTLTGSAGDDVVVAKVGEKEIFYSDLETSYMQYRPQYEKKYDLNDAEVERMLMMNELDYIIEQTIVSEWAKDMGIEADPEKYSEKADALYKSMLSQRTNSYMETDDMSQEKAAEKAAEYLESHHYTSGQIAQMMMNDDLNKRLKEHYKNASAPSEENIREEFDRLVASAKERYEASPEDFDYDITKSELIYYYPSGYRVVRHLMFMFSDEAQSEAREILAQRMEVGADGEQIEALNSRMEALVDPYRSRIARAQEQYESGVSFEELIKTIGEDPGMKEGITAERGYYVSQETSAFGPEFRDAAMAIEKVSDLSQPVVTEYGIHLIRYEKDAPEGAADYDELKPLMELGYREKALEGAYQSAYKQWLEKNPVEKYLSRVIAPSAG